MRKMLATTVAIGLTAAFGMTSVQAQPAKRYDPGTQTCRILTQENLHHGYELFQENCKSCHHRGNEQGADFLYSESKSMEGWNRVFGSKYPDCADEGKWDKLTRQELLIVNDYLFANAYDSNNPHCYV